MTHENPFAVEPTETTTLKPKKYTIETAIGEDDWTFTGVMLGSSSTKATARFARWTEMNLYRVTEGPNAGQYILETVGCSDVFHRIDSGKYLGEKNRCRQNGEVIPSDDLSDDAVPCPFCRPAGVSGDDPLPELVSEEVDFTQISIHATPLDVLTRIREGARGRVSIPAQRLLAMAATHDPLINDTLSTLSRVI